MNPLLPRCETLRPSAKNAPKRTGKFTWGARVATGGMGHVYRGVMQVAAGVVAPVALKQMHADLARDPRYVRMFLDEVRLGLSVSHPGFCRVRGFSGVGAAPWAAFEWIEGPTLLQCLQAQQGALVPVPHVVEIARQLTDALQALHALPGAPVHRDVSPTNISLGVDGRVVLLDLGIAAPTGTRDVGKVVGKARYVSPEQVAGLAVDGRSDLFALGVVVHELLTGRALFTAPTPLESLRAVRDTDVPDVRTLRRDVPPALAGWLRNLLARDPSRRFSTAVAARAALGGLDRSGSDRLGAYADDLTLPAPARVAA